MKKDNKLIKKLVNKLKSVDKKALIINIFIFVSIYFFGAGVLLFLYNNIGNDSGFVNKLLTSPLYLFTVAMIFMIIKTIKNGDLDDRKKHI